MRSGSDVGGFGVAGERSGAEGRRAGALMRAGRANFFCEWTCLGGGRMMPRRRQWTERRMAGRAKGWQVDGGAGCSQVRSGINRMATATHPTRSRPTARCWTTMSEKLARKRIARDSSSDAWHAYSSSSGSSPSELSSSGSSSADSSSSDPSTSESLAYSSGSK